MLHVQGLTPLLVTIKYDTYNNKKLMKGKAKVKFMGTTTKWPVQKQNITKHGETQQTLRNNYVCVFRFILFFFIIFNFQLLTFT